MISKDAGRAGWCPREVRTAFRISLAAMAVEAATWLLDVFVIPPTGFDELRSTLGTQGAALQLALSAGFLLLTDALWLFLALRMRQGRNWARIVLAVLGAIGSLSLLADTGMNGFDWSIMRQGVPTALAVGAAVLMFLPACKPHFAPARAE
ncbi:hypothetical protein [Kitasatospora sp. NPDC001175]|uniref:hypothetical protein n=1 Tax=Kitasatospora sp. NPDC001175 TaxID=3157103 RepID=UPI003D0052A8